MTDKEAVAKHLDARKVDGALMSDGCARTIASWWQGPGTEGEQFSILASTGAIPDPREMAHAITDAWKVSRKNMDDEAAWALVCLLAYVMEHSPRENVPDWQTRGIDDL